MKTIFVSLFLVCMSFCLLADDLTHSILIKDKKNANHPIPLIVKPTQLIIGSDTLVANCKKEMIDYAIGHFLAKNSIDCDSAVYKLIGDSIHFRDSVLRGKAAPKGAKVLIRDRVAAIDSDAALSIATVRLRNENVKMYIVRGSASTDFAPKKTMVRITSASISFESGYIKDIAVSAVSEGGDSVFHFSNQRYISLRDARDIDNLATKSRNMLTFMYSKSSLATIDMRDVFEFERTRTLESGTYVCADTTLRFTKAPEVLPLKKSSIANSLNLRIYTDPLGYEKKNPNGVLQMEAQLNFILNTIPTHRKYFRDDMQDVRFDKSRYNWVWLSRISPYMKLTKIEESNSVLAIGPESASDMMELFKYAYLDLGTELNVLSFKSDSKLFTGNIAAGLWRTKVGNDSVDNASFFVSTVYVNPKLDFRFVESDRIDFSLALGVYGAWQVNPITKEELAAAHTHLTSFSFMSERFWGQVQQNINLHPGGDRYKSIFIRANQYIGFKNNHFSFQVGYSTPISDVLK